MTTQPVWSQRLYDALSQLANADESRRDALMAEAWPLLRTSLLIRSRQHASRYGSVSAETLEDLASEKALDLLRRIVSGRWDISGHAPGELASFLSTAAHNALVDSLRREGRLVHPEANPEGPGWDAPAYRSHAPVAAHLEPAGLGAERDEYARYLANCVDGLTDDARVVWFFRVLLEMSSKEIADHPEVNKTPGNVDVILQRARAVMTECMTRKGHDPTRMPQGTFTAIWERYRARWRRDRDKVSNE